MNGRNKAELEELKFRFRSIARKHVEDFEKKHPRPDVPKDVSQAQAEWDEHRESLQEEIYLAADQFFERVVFDHENAMLLLKDFRSQTFEGKTP